MGTLRCAAAVLLMMVFAVGYLFADDLAPTGIPAAAASGAGRLLLTNVHVFDVDAGVMTGAQDILIEDGRIAATGALGKFPDVVVIDCSGKYAVPGLFDCHTHVANLRLMGDSMMTATLGRFVDKGITQLRDVGGPLAVLQPLRARIESGEQRGPDIFYTGPMLEKSPLMWEQMNMANPGFTVAVDSVATADRMVPELIRGGARCMKVFGKFDRDVFAHLVGLARAASLPVVHDPGLPLFHQVPIDFSIDCGVGSIEHGKAPWPIVLVDSLAQEQDALTRANAGPDQRSAFVVKVAALGVASVSREKLQAVLDKMIARGVFFCPTLHVFIEMAQQAGPPGAGSDSPSSMAKILRGMEEVSRFFTREAAARGVRILVGQDGVFPENTLAEMQHLRDCGLSAAEILKGATIYPAIFLAATDRYGAIAPGRVANILVVDQDPLAAIEDINGASLVVQNGRVVYAKDGGDERPTAAQPDGPDRFETVRVHVQAWLSHVTGDPLLLSPSTLKATIVDKWEHQRDRFQIVSVRKPEDFRDAGHIPNAVNILWTSIVTDEALASLDSQKTIVLYCYYGHASMLACTILGLLGYTCRSLDFGMMGWNQDALVKDPWDRKADYEVERTVNKPEAEYRLPILASRLGDAPSIVKERARTYMSSEGSPVIVASDVKAIVDDWDRKRVAYQILDVRSEADYAAGHVPHALCTPWGKLAELENLKKLDPAWTTIVCSENGQVGQLAATVLNVLGYPATAMKFGMMDWNRQFVDPSKLWGGAAGYPVVRGE